MWRQILLPHSFLYAALNFFNFDVLQHVYGIFLVGIVFRLFFALLKTSVLAFMLKFSCKKVVRKFGQNVKSIYLCIRNREGHPLEMVKKKEFFENIFHTDK